MPNSKHRGGSVPLECWWCCGEPSHQPALSACWVPYRAAALAAIAENDPRGRFAEYLFFRSYGLSRFECASRLGWSIRTIDRYEARIRAHATAHQELHKARAVVYRDMIAAGMTPWRARLRMGISTQTGRRYEKLPPPTPAPQMERAA